MVGRRVAVNKNANGKDSAREQLFSGERKRQSEKPKDYHPGKQGAGVKLSLAVAS